MKLVNRADIVNFVTRISGSPKPLVEVSSKHPVQHVDLQGGTFTKC